MGGGGLARTILTYVCMRLLSNKELQDAVIDLIMQRAIKFLGPMLGLIADHATKLLTVVFTGVVASFVILPQIKTELNASLVSEPDYQEVLNVKHG